MFFYETMANSCCGNDENALYSLSDTREVISQTDAKVERELKSIDRRQILLDRTKDDEDKEEIGLKGTEFLPGAARQKLSERSFDPIDSLSGPHEEFVDEISRTGIEIHMDNENRPEPTEARASSEYVEEEVPSRREASDVYVENHPITRQESEEAPIRRQESDEAHIRSNESTEFSVPIVRDEVPIRSREIERTVEFHEYLLF